jgi:protein-tyrosine phosphatase
MLRHILVVCIGNICRSPMAESLLAHRLSGREPDIRIGSAGLAALVGRPADPIAQALMQERGLAIGEHRARQVTRHDIMSADLILAMDSEQQRLIESSVPVARGKVHRLGKWGDFDIPDPYGEPRPAFEWSLSLIEEGIKGWETRL